MDINNSIMFLAIGALAGWLAGNIMKGRGFGVVGNVFVGIVGAIAVNNVIQRAGRSPAA